MTQAARTKRGVTLIETLVYLALFTIVIGGLVASAYAFFESIGHNQVQAMMQEEQDFLIAKIDWALDGAQTVSLPAANASGGALSVTKFNGDHTTIASSGGNVTFNGNALNNTNVTISNLIFVHTVIAGINAPESVEAGFTISVKTPNGMTLTQTASTTRYLHK